MKHFGIILLLGFLTIAQYEINCDPLLLISLDGLQSDVFDNYLKNHPNSSFNEIINTGVKADYMIPSFPSVTWPNHYTLVTGLYPESHGVIDNYMYDPDYNEKVNFLGGVNSYEPKFWKQGKPIWITGDEQGLKTASSYWIGSDVIGQTSDIWLRYDSSYYKTFVDTISPKDRVNDVLNWIDKFKLDFTALYISQPDSSGHLKGPDSPEYVKSIEDDDNLVGAILDKLKSLKIYDNYNIVLTSDHGMAAAKSDCKINAYNYLNDTLIDMNKSIFGIIGHIYPNSGYETVVYNILKKVPNIDTYYKNEVPEKFHFSNNRRISPIVVIAREGYSFLSNTSTCLTGLHGYDNYLQSMRTVFIARGPAFQKQKKLAPFENVNVYPLLCKILQIKCEQNNGTASVFDAVLNGQNTIHLKNKEKSVILLLIIVQTFFLFSIFSP